MARYWGVLCHVTSLPSGDLDDAERFIDFIADSGANSWQMLPITPPDQHGSPYASPSAFAAWEKLGQATAIDMSAESYWLDDWLLFEAIKKQQNGTPWTDWPVELRDRHPEALAKINIVDQSQSRFMGRWNQIKSYAKQKQISLIGDLPIFIAHDSADVWAHRELFLLEPDGYPSVVAGVPPDYFSQDGQKWGTVLYDWPAHRAQGWEWWKQRMARMMRLFDIVRIDHFRGFHSAWAIPTTDENAKNGIWIPGPGDELVAKLVAVAGSPKCIIAEDLGIIPAEVIELRKRHKLEGMAVLQFGFDDENPDNPHNPKNIKLDQVVYTGTHDNNTTIGWWKDSPQWRKDRINLKGDICDTLIEMALDSSAGMAIIPLQDILKLGSEARMNTPGTTIGNWNWRFDWDQIENVQIDLNQAAL
jgi:4-alpha-glucanotransferase